MSNDSDDENDYSLNDIDRIGGKIKINDLKPIKNIFYNNRNEKIERSDIQDVARKAMLRLANPMVTPNKPISDDNTYWLFVFDFNNVDINNKTRTEYTLTDEERDVIIGNITKQSDFNIWDPPYHQSAREVQYPDYLFPEHQLTALCWRNTISWVKKQENDHDACVFDKNPLKLKNQLIEHGNKIKGLAHLCADLDVSKIVNKEPSEHYGNCVQCYGIDTVGIYCRRSGCNYGHLSHIVRFKNNADEYMNPKLIHDILYKRCTKFMEDELLETKDSIVVEDVYFPLQVNEYISTDTFPCVFKLLYLSIINNNDDKDNFIHVMNEVVTTSEIMQEVLKVISQFEAKANDVRQLIRHEHNQSKKAPTLSQNESRVRSTNNTQRNVRNQERKTHEDRNVRRKQR